MSATDSTSDPRGVLDLDKLLKQNPDVDDVQIREVRAFVQERRREGHGKSYDLDSPYERGPITGLESRS